MISAPVTKTVVTLWIGLLVYSFWRSSDHPRTPRKHKEAKVTQANPMVTQANPMVTQARPWSTTATGPATQPHQDPPASTTPDQPAEDEVVVSLGTITDLGRQAAAFLPMLRDIKELSTKDPILMTAGERVRLANLQRDHATFLGALPEIAAFQDNPPEYGKFFGSLAREAASLTDAQAAAVENYMRQRSESMVQQGMKTTDAPEDPEAFETWEKKRDAFIEETADGLADVMPPGSAAKAGLDDRFLEFLEMDFAKAQQEK